jgi:hypothetical protein
LGPEQLDAEAGQLVLQLPGGRSAEQDEAVHELAALRAQALGVRLEGGVEPGGRGQHACLWGKRRGREVDVR